MSVSVPGPRPSTLTSTDRPSGIATRRVAMSAVPVDPDSPPLCAAPTIAAPAPSTAIAPTTPATHFLTGALLRCDGIVASS